MSIVDSFTQYSSEAILMSYLGKPKSLLQKQTGRTDAETRRKLRYHRDLCFEQYGPSGFRLTVYQREAKLAELEERLTVVGNAVSGC